MSHVEANATPFPSPPISPSVSTISSSLSAHHSPVSDRPTDFPLQVVAGTAHKKLVERICRVLDNKPVDVDVGRFADGEIKIEITNNIRGADVFLIQPTCGPDMNSALIELLLFIHTLRQCSAARITAFIPYFGYSRQDQKTRPRTPISAAAVAQLLESTGVDRVVTVDLHADQIQGFFHKIPVDNLYAEIEFANYFKTCKFPLENVAIVAPDAGSVPRARRFGDLVGAPGLITILTRKSRDLREVVGEVEGKICIIVDDIIDSGETIVCASEVLKAKGATKIYACAAHGLLNYHAINFLNDSCIEEVWITDTVPQEEHLRACSKLVVITLAPLLAECIRRIHNEQSLSVLFRPNRTTPSFKQSANLQKTPSTQITQPPSPALKRLAGPLTKSESFRAPTYSPMSPPITPANLEKTE